MVLMWLIDDVQQNTSKAIHIVHKDELNGYTPWSISTSRLVGITNRATMQSAIANETRNRLVLVWSLRILYTAMITNELPKIVENITFEGNIFLELIYSRENSRAFFLLDFNVVRVELKNGLSALYPLTQSNL